MRCCWDHVTGSAAGVFFFLLVQLVICGEAEYCGSPPNITGARYNSTLQTYYAPGTALVYTCQPGYYKQGGDSIVRCIGNNNIAWEYPRFSCAPVACGDPGNVANAERQGHLWTFRSKVEYFCNDGYLMTSGSAIRYCQANTKWSGELPSCTIINCSIPESPENGQALYSGLTFGSIVKYECNNRLAVHGNERRICQSSGHWTGSTPRCIEVDCGMPRLDYPTGKVKVMHDTGYNGVIEYKCDSGETERATCHKHGQWLPPPPDCMNKTIIFTTTTSDYQQGRTSEVTEAPPRRWRICNYRILRWICMLS